VKEIVETFQRNNERLRDLLFAVIPRIPGHQDDLCSTALTHAVIGH
jgi:hypothetical protein